MQQSVPVDVFMSDSISRWGYVVQMSMNYMRLYSLFYYPLSCLKKRRVFVHLDRDEVRDVINQENDKTPSVDLDERTCETCRGRAFLDLTRHSQGLDSAFNHNTFFKPCVFRYFSNQQKHPERTPPAPPRPPGGRRSSLSLWVNL